MREAGPAPDESPSGAHPRDRLKRELSLVDAVFLVVASVIGAGIFFTPGRVAELLPAPHWILAAWGVGALLSLAGALANAELGGMFPRAGGDYVYLREGVHPVAGFLVGWMSFLVIYAGTIAALALAAAGSISGWLGWGATATTLVGVALILALSFVNLVGVRWGARANNLTSFLKLAALLAFCILGPLVGDGEAARLFPGSGRPDESSSLALDFGRAMSPVLFSYLGWNASVYVASEIKNPSRNLPASLFIGLGVCSLVYMLVNCVYLYALPMETLSGIGDAGEAAALALFGPVGGGLVAAFVLLSVLGTLNAMVLVGPRIVYAMALDGLFFGSLERVSEGFRTPTVAILVQAAISVLLVVVLKNFLRALDFTTFAIVLATMADVVALYRLRRLQPDRERPYRAWGYPVVPGLYLLANFGIALAMLWGSPFECAMAALLLLSGLPIYLYFARRRRAEAG
jgi:APA family basic amino acid/polyamine antiporter